MVVSSLSKITIIGVITAIAVRFLLSPIPKNLGLYTFLASKFPELIGTSPAFHHGVEWKYDFDKLYNSCSDIQGQNALITGANSGVGFETAKALAKCGVNVTMGCRNPKKCNAAAQEVREYSKNNGYDNVVSTMIVDTSKLKSVQSFAEEYLSIHDDGALDMLYLNAGIGGNNSSKERLSDDGIELVFATNYVGHHLMYRLLEPLLLKSKMARVIQTSSSTSFTSFPWKVATSLEQLNDFRYKAIDFRFYNQSKLAQILWAKHLTKRLGSDSNIYVNAGHPGAVDTGIWLKNKTFDFLKLQGFVTFLRHNIMWTAEEGALTLLYLGAAVQEIKDKDIRGKYYHPQAQEVINPLSLDETLQEDLWKFSDELVAKFL